MEAASGSSPSQKCCNDVCRFFLGESAKITGMGLCSNPNYIKSHESCLAAIGLECDYCATDDVNAAALRQISFEYTGLENRRSPRDLVYNSAIVEIMRGTQIVEIPSVILDISLEGVGCIVPVMAQPLPTQFDLIKKPYSGNTIKLKCQTRRVIKHSSVTEIGATFKERISFDIMALLLKTM
jgi:hypothetical protein